MNQKDLRRSLSNCCCWLSFSSESFIISRLHGKTNKWMMISVYNITASIFTAREIGAKRYLDITRKDDQIILLNEDYKKVSFLFCLTKMLGRSERDFFYQRRTSQHFFLETIYIYFSSLFLGTTHIPLKRLRQFRTAFSNIISFFPLQKFGEYLGAYFKLIPENCQNNNNCICHSSSFPKFLDYNIKKFRIKSSDEWMYTPRKFE